MTRFLGALAALFATAAAWAPLRRPLALRSTPKQTVLSAATNADWRTRCDTAFLKAFTHGPQRLAAISTWIQARQF